MAGNDYTGVPTSALADLIDEHLNRDEEFDITSWAKVNGFDQTTIDDVRRADYQITSLTTADLICTAFGLNVSFSLPVIPRKQPGSARKMAMDEWIAEHSPDPFAEACNVGVDMEWVNARTATLEKQRDALIGPMTDHQRDVQAQDAVRAQRKKERRRAAKAEQPLSLVG